MSDAAPGLGLPFQARWALFRTLERLSDLRGNSAAGHLDVTPAAQPEPALWVFVSTIGELNAIDPLLRELAARLSRQRLVLITDHPHYRPSYEARYPQAVVCVSRGHSDDAATLAKQYPPRLLIVAEIPCLPSDAPCRFSMAFVAEARRHRAPAAIVNGWLYHYAPASRMDAIERRWFARDYLRTFDRLCVQTEAVADRLAGLGAERAQLVVAGNIKFDAMQRSDWSLAQARSPKLLGGLLAAGRPTVVAGCVTNAEEQNLVLEAFGRLRQRHPAAVLVLAPRHPENAERMGALRALLAEYGLAAIFRSQCDDAPLADDIRCLVLDTMGDLRDFYAAATVAHVGVDHNVLEPLGFHRPVTVRPGWESTYPSYPVYRLLHEQQALLEADDANRLSAHWIDAAGGQVDERVRHADAALARARGAVERHLRALAPLLEAVQ